MHLSANVILMIAFAILKQNCNGFALDKKNIDLRNILKHFNSFGDPFLTTETAALQDILLYGAPQNEDIKLNIKQITKKYGYDLEEHFVTTKDGYILNLQRIPKKGPPVLLMHGILLSSDDYFIAGPENALAYYLSDEGYDVWIGNYRGNKYSRNHTTLSPMGSKFWDFSWDEMGRYDLPAFIDYILKTTRLPKLSYVGFSQGTTTFFVMCSELPQYNDKISIMIALSPIAFVPNAKSPIVRFMAQYHISDLLSAIGINEFLPYNKFYRLVFSLVCGNNRISMVLCSNLVFILFGFDRGETNVTNLPVIFSHAPGGCSTKQTIHYFQCILSGEFRNFDYGQKKNLEMYGSLVPPDYPVQRIKAPVALFYSDTDWFSNVTDVMTLKGKLNNVVDSYFIENVNHVDFLWGKNIKDKLYIRALYLIQSYLYRV